MSKYKKILLIGSSGFLGKNLASGLQKQKIFKVFLFDYYYKSKNKKNIIKKDKQDALKKIIAKYRPHVICYLAASLSPSSSRCIGHGLLLEIKTLTNVLEIMLKNNIFNIVFFSSAGTVYGKSTKRNCESDKTNPVCLYGFVKKTLESILLFYAKEKKIKPLILRLANPYGPHHKNQNQGFINLAIQSAINQKKIMIWGDGSNKKDFIFVDDCIEIIISLLKKKISNSIVNIGTGKEASLNTICNIIKKWYPNFAWNYLTKKNYDVENYKINVSLQRKITSKKKFTSLRSGIFKTICWYKKSK